MVKKYNTRVFNLNDYYSTVEVAELLNVHRSTIQQWKKDGLISVPNIYPILFLGNELKFFLENRMTKHKTCLQDNELYCVKCKKAVTPLNNEVVLVYLGRKIGNEVEEFTIKGICPNCNTRINRISSYNKLNNVIQHFNVKDIIQPN